VEQSSAADLVVEVERLSDRTIIRVSGELDLHTSASLVHEIDGFGVFDTPVTFDMTHVAFIDSTGIRSLLTLNSDVLDSTGAPLRVEGASGASRRLFSLTGIDAPT
jgi:anti-anti-sigma factor